MNWKSVSPASGARRQRSGFSLCPRGSKPVPGSAGPERKRLFLEWQERRQFSPGLDHPGCGAGMKHRCLFLGPGVTAQDLKLRTPSSQGAAREEAGGNPRTLGAFIWTWDWQASARTGQWVLRPRAGGEGSPREHYRAAAQRTMVHS